MDEPAAESAAGSFGNCESAMSCSIAETSPPSLKVHPARAVNKCEDVPAETRT